MRHRRLLRFPAQWEAEADGLDAMGDVYADRERCSERAGEEVGMYVNHNAAASCRGQATAYRRCAAQLRGLLA